MTGGCLDFPKTTSSRYLLVSPESPNGGGGDLSVAEIYSGMNIFPGGNPLATPPPPLGSGDGCFSAVMVEPMYLQTGGLCVARVVRADLAELHTIFCHQTIP